MQTVKKIIIILAAAFMPFNTVYGQKQELKQPNIILLIADDMRKDALGIMGNQIILTPHIDKLGREGMVFTNTYTTTSICCVSRAGILTGQYVARHKVRDFVTSLTNSQLQQTYPLLLKAAGYSIGYVGEYGVGKHNDQPMQWFDYWKSDKDWPHYEKITPKGDTLHQTDQIYKDIHKFLDTRKEGKPFCLSVGFKAPHAQDDDVRQFIPSKAYRDYYKDVTIVPPETAKEKYFRKLPYFLQNEKTISRERWRLRFADSAAYQQSVKNYYRLITHIDDVVGKLVHDLEAKKNCG